MAKGNGSKRGSRCHSAFRCPLVSCPSKLLKDVWHKKKHFKPAEKKEWDNATCTVCMEYPHNAVLLLCSSFEKGCRPYMCATSQRYSNCLEQYKKAYTKVSELKCSQQQNGLLDNQGSTSNTMHLNSDEKTQVAELLCPLCRGQVKGWAVVERARKYFNHKKRACMKENCSFVGNFKALKKHVKAEHPKAWPRAIDPVLEEKWKRLEHERERNDVISTIVSSMPGAVVFGDYVIEPPRRGYYRDYGLGDYPDNGFLPAEPIDIGQNGLNSRRIHIRYDSSRVDDIANPPGGNRPRILVTGSGMTQGFREMRPSRYRRNLL